MGVSRARAPPVSGRGIAPVAGQIYDLEDVTVGVVEIGARSVDGAALPVLFEKDIDAVRRQLFFGGLVFVRCHDEGMMHVVIRRIDPGGPSCASLLVLGSR